MKNSLFRRSLWAGALLTIVLCAVVVTPSEGRSPYFDWTYDPIQFNPPVPERFVMDNGLTVHFLPDDRLPVVTVAATVRTGEVHVAAEKAGLAGITGSGLVTGGTASLMPDELDAKMEFLGIRLNGSIGDESGDFSLRCLAKDLDAGFSVFAELLQKPRFDSTKIALAVDQALEAWRRRNDSPRSIAGREFSKLIYADHPYGRTPDKTSLESLTRSDILDFYAQYFAPQNVILAVSGNLSREQLNALLGEHFAGWTGGVASAISEIQMPNYGTPGVYQIHKDINQTNIRFGHVGIDRKNPDRHAIRVLNYILGSGGFTSRMMGHVRSDSGWAYSVGTRFTTANQPGLFFASCQTKSETTTKALALMKWVIDDLLENGVTGEELATAKESILNSDVFQYVTPSQIVNRYAWLEYHGFPLDQLAKDVEAIRAVTVEDANAAARQYLHPDRYTILAVGPTDKFDAPLSTFGNVKTITLDDE